MHLRVLDSETFESVKLSVHGVALGLSALMCAYNAAAWLQRRQRHLAVNTVVYAGAIILEHQHVAHHWRTLREVSARELLERQALERQLSEGQRPERQPSEPPKSGRRLAA